MTRCLLIFRRSRCALKQFLRVKHAHQVKAHMKYDLDTYAHASICFLLLKNTKLSAITQIHISVCPEGLLSHWCLLHPLLDDFWIISRKSPCLISILTHAVHVAIYSSGSCDSLSLPAFLTLWSLMLFKTKKVFGGFFCFSVSLGVPS